MQIIQSSYKVLSDRDMYTKCILSTLSLIWPSYTIKATIFENVFRPKRSPKTEYFQTKRVKCSKERSITANPNAYRNIQFNQK